MKHLSFKYSLFFALFVVATSCSNQKNTSLSRGYHNLTSRYNILFNGRESFEKGMQKLEQNHSDNFSEVLPVFIYHNKDEISAIGSEMDRAIAKCAKLISLHSITAKPVLKEGDELSDAEREFYSKKEYNKWVDDAYLLMGKSYFYKHDFDKASETFQYIVSNFPEGASSFEARLWLAHVAHKKNRIKESENILAELKKDGRFPKKLAPDLDASLAAIEISKGNLVAAIDPMRKAAETVKPLYYQQRYNYILAQLLQLNNQLSEASLSYKKVIKLNPPYEMTFNARINLALSFQAGQGSRKEVEKQLQKMLRDDKNNDYQDQIYFAIGNLYFQEGNTTEALKYYRMSSAVSLDNSFQKPKTYLTMADIYYAQADYIPAQAYYDSTVQVIEPDYTNYKLIYTKSVSLTKLVESIVSVQLEDSLLRLSAMPKPELIALIDKTIAEIQKKEQEQRLLEQEQRIEQNTFAQQEFAIPTNSQSWYFYNATTIELGRQEFKRKWGSRRLEDNWRRSNKGTLDQSFALNTETDAEDTLQTGEKKLYAAGKYSRDYYMQQIPFTDSAKTKSHLRIQESLLISGDVYSEELKDYQKAIDAYEDILIRYPDYPNRLLVYYKLYTLGKETRNIDMVSQYQQRIIREFPESNYARVLIDPEYSKRLEEEERKEEVKYQEIYQVFDQGDYAYALQLINQARSEWPESKHTPQYDLMAIIAEGVSKDTASFIADLDKLMVKYPGTDIAERSGQIIKFLQTESPQAAREHAIQQATSIFTDTPLEEHFVVVQISRYSNANKLMFNIINFNIDNFADNELRVKKSDLDNSILLAVQSFKDKQEAVKYYTQIVAFEELFREVDKTDAQLFYISKSNYERLLRDKQIDQYLIFFNAGK